jgi:hypothetical protein
MVIKRLEPTYWIVLVPGTGSDKKIIRPQP